MKHVFSQNLDNTEWVQIQLFNKDGNEIKINHNGLSTKLYFKGDSLLRSNDEQYCYRDWYAINDNILSIGSSTKYKIDSVSDQLLVLTDLPNVNPTNNNVNTHVFLNADYVFDYLRRLNQLYITPDSLIQSDNFLCPTFDGDFDNFFVSGFDFNVKDEKLFCSFNVLPDGDISDVKVKSNQKASSSEINRIKNIITSTQGRWIIPPVPHGCRFYINFAAVISTQVNNRGVSIDHSYSFKFHADSLNPRDLYMLNPLDVAKEDDTFNYGVRLMKKENYDKAIVQFKKCLNINPSDVDALYDLAYCYQKTGNAELACENWKKLKDMGQKDGERLYNENCNTQH